MPRILYWLTGLFGTALLVALLLLLKPTDASDGIMRFDQASRCEEILDAAPLNSQGILSILNSPPLIQKDCWHPVRLPENNPIQDVKVDINNPQFRRIWYRVHYTTPEGWVASKPLMVYVPRIIANAWQIRINGKFDTDNRYEWRSTWNRPAAAIFFIDTDLPFSMVEINVGVIASKAEGFSMSRISVGDAATIRSQKIFREYLQVTMPQASSAAELLLGFFFMAFWLVRRSEIEYLILSFTSVVYSINNLRYTITQPGNPNLDAWFYALIYEMPGPWILWLFYLTAARFANYSNRCLEWLLCLFVIFSNLSALLDIFFKEDNSALRAIANISMCIGFIYILAKYAFINRSRVQYIIVLSFVLGILSGIYDTALLFNYINPERYLCSLYFGLVLFASFFFAIHRRYVSAITDHEKLNADLEQQLTERKILTQQLTEREIELRTQQNRLLELERAHTLAEERQRLMHDMHDGLGSSLLTTLSAIEKSNLPQYAVAEALRACIEDLRLIIDSLEPTANDLVTLLATIRYRLGQRLVSAGLELNWEINDLPKLPWLEPPDALNVLRLIQETLVNVLKHANATRIWVATCISGDYVEIQITDNGCGYDPQNTTPGRGTHSQAKRAERLGGELYIDSKLGQGTSLRLLLPINK